MESAEWTNFIKFIGVGGEARTDNSTHYLVARGHGNNGNN